MVSLAWEKLPALLVIDVQKAFDDPSWGKRNNPEAESDEIQKISLANLLGEFATAISTQGLLNNC